MTCRTPRCQKPAAEGTKWCPECGARLAKVRDEIEAGKEGRLRSAVVGRRKRKLREQLGETDTDLDD